MKRRSKKVFFSMEAKSMLRTKPMCERGENIDLRVYNKTRGAQLE